MDHGIGQSGKDAETNNSNVVRTRGEKRRPGFDDFAHSVARIAVAQMCDTAGFQGFQPFALDTLSDVAVRYIMAIGKTANSYANSACRTECNVFDVIQGMEDMSSGQGFSAASDVHHCLLGSGTMREIVRYVGYAEETPFAYSIPRFPVIKEQQQSYSFLQKGESPPDEHIPSWLPTFPDPQTYTNIPVRDEKGAQAKEEGIRQSGELREGDNSLLKWKQLSASNGFKSAISVDPGEPLQEKGSKVVNPFQRPPLLSGEKVVSNVPLPAKLLGEYSPDNLNHAYADNHESALDTLAAAVEANKSGQYDPEDGKKQIPLSRIPRVQFTFGKGWKSLKITASSQKDGDENIASWFASDD